MKNIGNEPSYLMGVPYVAPISSRIYYFLYTKIRDIVIAHNFNMFDIQTLDNFDPRTSAHHFFHNVKWAIRNKPFNMVGE